MSKRINTRYKVRTLPPAPASAPSVARSYRPSAPATAPSVATSHRAPQTEPTPLEADPPGEQGDRFAQAMEQRLVRLLEIKRLFRDRVQESRTLLMQAEKELPQVQP